MRTTIAKWIRYLLASPWDLATDPARLRPLRFRVATEADFPTCEALHRANEAHGVPTNHRAHFATALRNGTMLTLMVEDHERVVGCCGFQGSAEEPDVVWFVYGLVDPALHRKGIGTTMFLARVSLLPENESGLTIAISALETSLPYYRRFGFQLLGRWDSEEDGNRYPVAARGVSSYMIREAREKLAAAGVVVPYESCKIPRAKPQGPLTAVPDIDRILPR